jgi:uncharacterized membrane protein
MSLFSTPDWIALGCFAAAWIAYAIMLEWTRLGKRSLSARMDGYRGIWMLRMLARNPRIVDTQITASLQNGSAFFASTSLLAIGGTLALLRSTDTVLDIVAALPFGIAPTRVQWEAKVLGLVVIFAYAFFKFAWAYRLFNYVAIMIGAAPPDSLKDTTEAKAHAERTAKLIETAGRHFNRGQRAIFFALGYLGWFLGPSALIVTTIAVLAVICLRQFGSEALRGLPGDTDQGRG